ncbi:hypothetical protein OH76DRAFT_1483429 [Lentinus brumalis]|uniref:Uncharacterized protein n=1 Tax=Lentinus brumalis TaxID=2498619 RepID=A0A371D8S7_9APHY|nr:hypothetical protein OH76DRAFT_1483429 [Polyporus brumalis]
MADVLHCTSQPFPVPSNRTSLKLKTDMRSSALLASLVAPAIVAAASNFALYYAAGINATARTTPLRSGLVTGDPSWSTLQTAAKAADSTTGTFDFSAYLL